MDDWTWVAARAAQAVSRHLSAAESGAAKFSTRLRRAPIAALDGEVPANETPRASARSAHAETTLDAAASHAAASRNAA